MNMPSCAEIARHHDRAVACFACGYSKTGRLERAHAIPRAIGGSDDAANLALLCPTCHRAAPDTADAAYFWRWIDNHPERSEVGRMLARVAAVLPLIPQNYQIALYELVTPDNAAPLFREALARLHPVMHNGELSAATWARLVMEVADIAAERGGNGV